MSSLEQKRRELERQRSGAPEMFVCEIHGEHEGQVCLGCYALQQERVECETAPLRYVNTASALRSRVIAELAASDGA